MAARRSYGTGSLYVRADRNGRETWVGHWRSNGRQVKRAIGPKRAAGSRDGLTRPQAEAEMRRLIATVSVAPVVGAQLTIGELGARYVEQQRRQGRKRASIVAVESVLRVWLEPYFGDRPVDTITPKDVADFMRILEEGRKPGSTGRSRPLSVKSIRNYMIHLSALFNLAERKGWATSNPCRRVDLPAAEPTSEDIRFLEPHEVTALAVHARPGPYQHIDRALYLTAAMTGLRQGELVALRWRDVDWTAGRIRVRQNHVLGEFGTPKSRRSTRSVPMADAVAAELDRLSTATRNPGDDDLVFGHPLDGTPISKAEILKRYRKALRAARLDEALTFHCLRHTFGTRMAAAGVPMRTLQEWLGHRDVQTTQIYADYAPSAHEAAMVATAFSPPSNPAIGRGNVRGSNLSESHRTSDD